MKVTYEIENEKKVKVKTYADGRVYKYDEKGNKIYYKHSDGYEKSSYICTCFFVSRIGSPKHTTSSNRLDKFC